MAGEGEGVRFGEGVRAGRVRRGLRFIERGEIDGSGMSIVDLVWRVFISGVRDAGKCCSSDFIILIHDQS